MTGTSHRPGIVKFNLCHRLPQFCIAKTCFGLLTHFTSTKWKMRLPVHRQAVIIFKTYIYLFHHQGNDRNIGDFRHTIKHF